MHQESACCAPSSTGDDAAGPGSAVKHQEAGRRIPAPAVSEPRGERAYARADGDMVLLPGGRFLMGSDDPVGYPADGEGPVHPVALRPFRIDSLAVTNAAFAAFVKASGYVTDAQ